MTGTYRLVLRYELDGCHSYGNNARKARTKNKNIDRRIKRREHARIIRKAVNSFYEDQQLDLIDLMNWEEEELSFYDDDDYIDYLNDNQDDYYDDYSYDPYPYEPYDDYSYADDWYSSRSYVREEEPEDRILKQADVGKTLADILQEINTRKYT